jgi:hypothetical protein
MRAVTREVALEQREVGDLERRRRQAARTLQEVVGLAGSPAFPARQRDVRMEGAMLWLELKKMELAQVAGDRGLPPATGRIEMADLRERVRKLEAIAAGIDL